MSKHLLATALLAAFAPLGAFASSGADTIARSSVAANGPYGDTTASWNYYTPGGASLSKQSATSIGSSSGSATTAHSQASDASSDAYGNYTASSTADANLATASVSAMSANGGFIPGHSSGGEAHPYAQIYDNLTFTAAGATASTISTFDITFTVDSALLIAPGTTQADGSGYAFTTFAMYGVDARANVYFDNSTGAIDVVPDTYPSAVPNTWVVTGGTDKTLVFTAQVSFQGPTWTTPFTEATEQQCYNGIQCSSDAHIAFGLPSSVTMTSESGAFLTAGSPSAVPEPQNALLLLAGLGALGMAARRRARAARA